MVITGAGLLGMGADLLICVKKYGIQIYGELDHSTQCKRPILNDFSI
jgi:hypothetical protein